MPIILSHLSAPKLLDDLNTASANTSLSVQILELQDGSLRETLERTQPKVLILAVNSLGAFELDQLADLQSVKPLPIVVFALEQGRAVSDIVGVGVQVYLLEPPRHEKIELIVSLAIERFNQWQGLRTELVKANQKLSERKLIEKAKGILMQQKALSEQQAYEQIRRSAMDQGLPMSELATRIIAVVELLD